MDHRGAHMVPSVIDPLLFGMDSNTVIEMEPEDYCAKVLAAICEAALQYHPHGGMLINYAQLPDAVWSSISKFFGFSFTDAEMQIIKDVPKLDAKNAALVFQNDSAEKQEKATERVCEAANRWLYPLYEELEGRRLSQPTLTFNERSQP
jgi:hypothetical protein